MKNPSGPPLVRLVDSHPPSRSRARSFGDYIFGRRLAAEEEEEHRIGPLAGVPVLGLDALSSAAYGPEAALTLLLPIGALAIRHVVPITAIIIGLLLIVYFSYRQTISAYPNGGGSYTVAKENLDPRIALLAGASLAIDYILNVAVGISAGVGALVSAFPALLPFMAPLCLGILAFLTVINLRGTRDTGLTFLVPTYLVRAFASGCTAMTGVEAVSNGVPIFRRPTVPNAQRALTLIILILVGLLAGIALLCRIYGIGATEPGAEGYQSVLSELTGAVIGRGSLYYVTMGAVVAVLCLSANTSFADFPRLCRVLSLDRYLPDTFAIRGRRLVFSYGVVVLAVLAGLLLLVFGGVTDRLIPLFAIGAFLAFTVSQAGMVAHWRKETGPDKHHSLWINLVGAIATGITTVVVVVSKFAEGAWVAVFALLALVFLFSRINRHYREVARQVADEEPLDLTRTQPPIVVVPIQAWNRLARRGLRFAAELSTDVHGLHILTQDSTISELTVAWDELVGGPSRAAGRPAPQLVLKKSTYRQFLAPLIDYVEQLRDDHPNRDVVVIVPDLVVRRWYHRFLHNNRGTWLRTLLRLRGGPRVIVVNTPFYLAD